MSTNKRKLIWIGILVLIGIVLLMVACETGVLSSQNPQVNDEPEVYEEPVVQQESIEPTIPLQEDIQLVIQEGEEKPAMLTIGKPFSGKLVEDGAVNILIIGEDKLNGLYDTIGIASVDKDANTLKLIMIPRDTYIEYNQEIISKLEAANLDKEPGVYKINYAHQIGSRIEYSGKYKSGPSSFLAEVIEEKFKLEIDDYMKINTKGFKALIDYLDGVDIYVPYNMDYDDPSQELYIHIAKGMQHLDGEDAEGFVRFRQGYNEEGELFEIGDTGRKKNQLDFMKAIIKQKGTIKNVGKIPGIIDLLGRNVQHSIGVGDVLQKYVGMAKDIIYNEYDIAVENLKSEKMTRINGSSYIVLD